MNTKVITTGLAAVLLLLGITPECPAPPIPTKTGTLRMKEAKVSRGFVIYTVEPSTYAVATDGTIVHKWQDPNLEFEIRYAKPVAAQPGCLLARIEREVADETVTSVAKIARDGNVLQEVVAPANVRFHHDHQLAANGNILVLCSKVVDRPDISDQPLTDDCVVEYGPDGQVVWEWQTADHFDDFAFEQEELDGIFERGGDWAHANSLYELPADTSHTDPAFRPGNLIISYRFLDSVVVIDRETGNIVYRTDRLTVGQHDAKMLPDSLIGGGNILIFDNGFGGKYASQSESDRRSSVVEVDPVTSTVAWSYDARLSGLPGDWLWSGFIGGAERLPNGNTLICEGAFGHLIEVTDAGELVWEYVNPVVTEREDRGIVVTSNRVYRAHKVPPSWMAPTQ